MTLKVSNLLEELGCKSRKPPVILEDNDGARATATGCIGGKKRCRHLDLKYHLVRESYEEGKLSIERVDTRDQAADILTKGNHGRVEWNRLVGLAGMVDTACIGALRKGA
ncbi:MAG: Ty1/Copia family ribonuclease HI [Gammaproteobacteria bacterium]|nr:Ty1/Copia family ribonuclease HI [Gammaproteobacteria bacterium]